MNRVSTTYDYGPRHSTAQNGSEISASQKNFSIHSAT
jgi:hypothetical protein